MNNETPFNSPMIIDDWGNVIALSSYQLYSGPLGGGASQTIMNTNVAQCKSKLINVSYNFYSHVLIQNERKNYEIVLKMNEKLRNNPNGRINIDNSKISKIMPTIIKKHRNNPFKWIKISKKNHIRGFYLIFLLLV